MCSIYPSGWHNRSDDGTYSKELFGFSGKAGFVEVNHLGLQLLWSFIFWVSIVKKNYSYTLQLESPDASPSMKISALRTLSYTLKTLGEVRHDHLVIIFGFLVFYIYIYI
jgi:hypothetical protein